MRVRVSVRNKGDDELAINQRMSDEVAILVVYRELTRHVLPHKVSVE